MADTEAVLKYVNENGPTDTLILAEKLGKDHQKIVGAVKSLQSFDDIIKAQQKQNNSLELTDEGKDVAKNGSYEAMVFNAITPEGVSQAELMKSVKNAKIGFSKAMQAGWIKMDKSAEGGPRVYRNTDEIMDEVQSVLRKIATLQLDDVSEAQKSDCKKRKLVQNTKVTSYLIEKGNNFTLKVAKQETELTPQMIATGSWKDLQFKELNFDAMGVMPDCGHLHPLLKVRAEYRQIFLEMGFTEMPTNNFIESSFWNFDTLFQPQQHPARDAHDTFFIKGNKGSVHPLVL